MNKLTSLAVATAFTLISSMSFSSHATEKHIESALIDVCKSALSNKVAKYQKTTKSYNLQNKTVALKVMCNGSDIIDFAQKHGAYKTAARIERSISGHVNIIDVAKIEKINVDFTL